MVAGHRREFEADRWRLGLAVATPHTALAEVGTLAWLARRHRSDAEFRAAVAAPQATTAKIRERLHGFDVAVAAAAARAGIAPADFSDIPGEAGALALSWQLLRALRVVHLALEGDDPADLSRIVAELVPMAGSAARVVEVWRRLVELSAGFAQAAATVDRAMLRRELGLTVLDGSFGPLGTGPVGVDWPGPELAKVRVSEADPRRLGVHAAIRVDGLEDGQPSYVERDIDGGERGLWALLARAAKRGGFVMLVGGSSVGKTRSAYEAVRAVLPDWSLVHPSGPRGGRSAGAPAAVADGGVAR